LIDQNEHVEEDPPHLNEEIGARSHIPDLRTTAEFIHAIRTATLENSNMKQQDIDRLREAPHDFPLDVEDPHFLFALRSFFAVTYASEDTYTSFRAAAMACYPDHPFLSYDQIKRRVEQISGVVPIVHDMCIKSCAAFTGPFADRDTCPTCLEPRYDPIHLARNGARVARRQFNTIPIGPVLQALYRSPESAARMHYRAEETARILDYMHTHNGAIEQYNDTYCGRDYLEAVIAGKIHEDDIMLQLSSDGAQLYRDKSSDCWISIFVIHNLSPDYRYKKAYVIPSTFVGGPNKPKHVDSFTYPSLHHLSALQKEGLRLWDASRNAPIPRSIPFVAFDTADSVAMASISGMVGHHGKLGCRLYCNLSGRHRTGDPHYYPVMLKPINYNVRGCLHEDVTFQDLEDYRQDTPRRYLENLQKLVAARNPADFAKLRLETGLCKQTILSGLSEEHTLGIPNMFLLDIMHLVALNDSDLFMGLWCGTIKCYPPDSKANWDWVVLKGRVWEAHGKTVAAATPFIPSSFDRAPRNIAEKINSGYKAWEFLLYLFGLGPALLHNILPDKYWRNYCKLVRGVQLLQQRQILPTQLTEGTAMLCEFVREFEEIYYQRRPDRIHFVRQSIQLLTHIGPETVRAGPVACYAQWTMETAIGNLGNEIRQDLDPYANISQRGLLRAQLNSIRSMMPHVLLNSETDVPRGGIDIHDGYVLLRACEEVAADVRDVEATAILHYWGDRGWPNQDGWPHTVKRWARLRLPNQQVARSSWMESRSRRKLRRTRNVKVSCSINTYFYFI
jgi:hypothetical protein